MNKKQVGVIFGSRSCEREVAIISAIQMMRHIDREKYDVIPVYIDQQGIWYTGDPLFSIDSYRAFSPTMPGIRKVWLDLTTGSGALLSKEESAGLIKKEKTVIAARIDVFLVVMHGLNGEDGTLQGMLELAGIPYSSTGVAGSAIGMDKIMMKQFFQGGGLPVLPGFGITKRMYQKNPQDIVKQIQHSFGFPVYVKPANLGSSIGVSRADDEESLQDSITLALEYDRRLLIEKGLEKPIELNCSVLGYDDEAEASPIEMPISSDDFLDFHEKYLASGGSKGMASLHRVLPAPIENELKDRIQELSKTIFHMLDCKGVVRIDYMFDKTSGELYITEINTIPGSLSFYLWENAGMSYSKLIDHLIQIAEKAYADKNNATYAYTSDILKNFSSGAKGAKGAKGSKGTKSDL